MEYTLSREERNDEENTINLSIEINEGRVVGGVWMGGLGWVGGLPIVVRTVVA